jgi:hypothetical protein
MKTIVPAALTILLAGIIRADCPTVPIACGFHGSGNFSPSCTGDFTLGSSTVTYPEEVFSITPPAGKALGATFQASEFGSAIFILDGTGNTIDSSVDFYGQTKVLTAATKISASGAYSIYIASPESSSTATYELDVTCDVTPPLIDHTMTKGLDQNVNPIDRTTTFGSADVGAWSWVEVGPMIGIHHVFWSFLQPGGALFQTTDVGFGINDTKTYDGKAGGGLFLIHQPAGLLPGVWTVNVLLDGAPLVTEHFTLVLQSMRPRVTGLTTSLIGPRSGR